MIVPQNTWFPTGTILKGKFAGQTTHYRSALWETLKYLKPIRCLEIGTHYGESAKVFQDYFDMVDDTGTHSLVTCDVRDYADLSSLGSVEFRQVYPHSSEVFNWHRVKREHLLPSFEDYEKSVQKNIEILKGDNKFDICFIDGCHTKKAFKKDIEIALQLSKWPHYLFIDNISDETHEQKQICDKMIKDSSWNKYLFNNWNVAIDFGVFWRV